MIASEWENFWTTLSNGLDVTFSREYMSPSEYMTLYTGVYNHCITKPLTTNDPEDLKIIEEQVNYTERLLKEDTKCNNLYQHIKNYVAAHVHAVYTKGQDLSGKNLLRFFTTEWKNFCFSSKVIHGMSSYLNRSWIRGEINDEQKNIYEVYTLALITWKKNFFDKLEDNVIKAMLELIYSERCGFAINNRYISGVIECLVELGIDACADETGVEIEPKKMTVYKNCFEVRFLESTKEFYTRESTQLLVNDGNVSDYMITAEKRLQQENDRVELYLNFTTQTALAECCERIFISDQLEFLQSHFDRLLIENKDEDLARMYKLCAKVNNGHDGLRVLLEKHITKEGNEALEQVAQKASEDPELYITTLLEVYERYKSLVSRSFENNPAFVRSLDKAATIFINNNAVTERVSGIIQHTKSAELLCRYCDLLHRKSSKMNDEAKLEDLQNKMVNLFKLLKDKDVFSKFYTSMLSKRLIGGSSGSEEAEINFIAKLTKMCGYEYTVHLTKMMKDTQVSKDLTSDFKENKSHLLGEKNIEVNIHVLSTGPWPAYSNIILTLPMQLSNTIEAFGKFYSEKFNGRRLSWVHSQCRGEVRSSTFNKTYVFSATAAQMCSLLLFNDQTSYKVQQISKATGMDTKTTSTIVGSLIKNRLLTTDTEIKDGNVPMTAHVSLNKSYSNTKTRVDLSKFNVKQELVREKEQVQKNIESDRKSLINACIVRIMKTRKRVEHQILMTEVITQLSGQFKPQVEMIKKCIASLIEKEYMLCVENLKETYEYIG